MKKLIISTAVAALFAAPVLPNAFGAPTVEIRLPERFRLITDQLFDLRVEAAGLADLGSEGVITINGQAASLPVPEVTTNNDTDPATLDKAWTYRGLSFQAGGVATIQASVEGVSFATRVGYRNSISGAERKT